VGVKVGLGERKGAGLDTGRLVGLTTMDPDELLIGRGVGVGPIWIFIVIGAHATNAKKMNVTNHFGILLLPGSPYVIGCFANFYSMLKIIKRLS
jgi:hypothetical protein